MKKKYISLLSLMLIISLGSNVYAMHIAEGFLPKMWCGFYFIISMPFVIIGLKQIRIKTKTNKDIKMLIGLVAAYCFVLSAMKIPSVTGSCSHPTGTGLAAIVFGPFVASVVSSVVLLFQALLLAHGGITTLGANLFSMGIAGPIVSYLIYIGFKNKNKKKAIFFSAMLGDLTTYMVTSIQLAVAFPSITGGVITSFIKFASIFAITQLPLAIVEGILTLIIFEFLESHSGKELKDLSEVR